MSQFVEGEYQLQSGSICYRLRSGSDPLLVFIYGGMGEFEQNTWDELVAALPEDLSILTFDRPGIGNSKKSELPRTAENIASELQNFLESLDFSRYLLVGHSIGGLYARYFACRFGQKVHGLVLLDATHEDQLTRGEKHYDQKAIEESIKNSAETPEGAVIPRDPDTSFLQMRQFPSLPENTPAVIAVAETSLPPQIPHATELNEINITLNRELSQTGERSQFHIIKDCSHFIYIDQPQKTADLIVSIL